MKGLTLQLISEPKLFHYLIFGAYLSLNVTFLWGNKVWATAKKKKKNKDNIINNQRPEDTLLGIRALLNMITLLLAQ